MENSQIYLILWVRVPPIYSQCFGYFPIYGNLDFAALVVDKSVDGFCRFFPQKDEAWEQEQALHPERSGVFIPYMAGFGVYPQYPHPLLLLLNP